jgi:hypothetical protein
MAIAGSRNVMIERQDNNDAYLAVGGNLEIFVHLLKSDTPAERHRLTLGAVVAVHCSEGVNKRSCAQLKAIPRN